MKKHQHFQNPDFYKALGQHIRRLREERGFGMRELALHADIEYSRLAKIEHGRTNATISTLMHIAEELGITHQELFDFKYPLEKKTGRYTFYQLLFAIITYYLGLMKSTFLLLFAIFSVHFCSAQTEIRIEEAAKHVGESVKVCGKVYGGKYLSDVKGTPTFLNIGASFPNQLLTVVIWGDHRNVFPAAPEELYNQKEVCVIGKVELYRDKPQIVIRDTTQIRVRQ